MAPKAASTEMAYTINGATLSGSDIKLLCAALSSLTAPMTVDMGAAAAVGGYTVGSFKTMWSALKKKCHLDGVAGTKPAGIDGDNEAVVTPKNTPGTGGRGRGRSAKIAVADVVTMGAGGPSPLTPGIPGLDALSMADGLATPDTPSKSTFDNNTVSSKKRPAADAEDLDANGNIIEQDTPAKKKRTSTPRKPRLTAKQKKEAEAAAVAEESAYFYGEDEQVSVPAEAATDAGEI